MPKPETNIRKEEEERGKIAPSRPHRRRDLSSPDGPQLLLVLGPDLVDGHLDLGHVVLGLLDGGAAVALAAPALDVLGHLVIPALLLLNLVAQLALARLVVGVVDELEPARLARPVLLVALLAEVAPFPIPALPARLFEITHFLGGGVPPSLLVLFLSLPLSLSLFPSFPCSLWFCLVYSPELLY